MNDSLSEIKRIEHRMQDLEKEALRTLAAQSRAAGDDTHYYQASLQHYTDWLILNGGVAADRDTVGDYLDAMNGRDWPRRWKRRARKVLPAVRKAHP